MTDKRKAESGLDEGDLTCEEPLIYLKEKKKGGNKQSLLSSKQRACIILIRKLDYLEVKSKPSCPAQPAFGRAIKLALSLSQLRF